MTGKLSDAIISAAKLRPGQKLTDGHSLYIFAKPDALQWRLRLKGSDRVLGTFPSVSVDSARAKAQALRRDVPPSAHAASLTGVPAAIAQIPKAPKGSPPTFGQIAADWCEHDKEITADALYRKRLYVGEKFKALLTLPITEITSEQCREVYAAVQAGSAKKGSARQTGRATAKRAGQYMSLIFEHAVEVKGVSAPNPAAGYKKWMGRSDRKALARRRQAHTADPAVFGRVMSAVDLWESPQGPTSSKFLRIVARIPVRAKELAGARWSEFEHLTDPKRAVWRIPASRMKGDAGDKASGTDHEVPLPGQVVALLLEQREYIKAHYPRGSEFVFPHRDTGTKHVEGINQNRMLERVVGDKTQSVHGFRHSFETIAAKVRGPQAAFLAHLCTGHVINGVMARYVTTDMPEHRRELLAWWSDEIERMVAAFEGSARV